MKLIGATKNCFQWIKRSLVRSANESMSSRGDRLGESQLKPFANRKQRLKDRIDLGRMVQIGQPIDLLRAHIHSPSHSAGFTC